MSVPRSVLVLASESLVWVKVSHQSSTKSHIWLSNEPCDAGRWEVSKELTRYFTRLDASNIKDLGGDIMAVFQSPQDNQNILIKQ
jgi:hypothetical protein